MVIIQFVTLVYLQYEYLFADNRIGRNFKNCTCPYDRSPGITACNWFLLSCSTGRNTRTGCINTPPATCRCCRTRAWHRSLSGATHHVLIRNVRHFVLFGICDLFAERSEWLRKHLEKIEAITQKSQMVKKYGIYTLILFIWVPGVGLYGCVLIAWLFKWRGVNAVAIIIAEWILATVLVLLTSLGILEIIL